jgi:hypothetical protein
MQPTKGGLQRAGEDKQLVILEAGAQKTVGSANYEALAVHSTHKV